MSFENKKKRGENPFTAQWGVTLRYPLLPQATAKQLVHIGAKHFFIHIRNHIRLSNFRRYFQVFHSDRNTMLEKLEATAGFKECFCKKRPNHGYFQPYADFI